MSAAPLLEVSNLSKSFRLRGSGATRNLRAVSDVSFSLAAGRTLALVGESGCGKSTTGRMILRLIEPTSGSIRLNGTELTSLHGAELKKLRRSVQIVFQDPMGSLNPRHSVRACIAEPLLVQGVAAAERRARVDELLRDVELDPAFAGRYPHELSGGQRQRVAIARALALRPQLIVADEPVSALDASIQAQILNMLLRLQQEHGLSYLFISHDLSVVRFIAHEVAVMYCGGIVEHGAAEAVFNRPAHPYTQALIAALPHPVPHPARVRPLDGSLPDASAPLAGCSFASRCRHAQEHCRFNAPPDIRTDGGQAARCWLLDGTVKARVNHAS